MGKHLLRGIVTTVVAIVMATGALAAPAGAVTVSHFQNLAAVVDCGSFEGDFYQSMRLTASLTGLTPDTAYEVTAFSMVTKTAVGEPIEVTTDGAGAAAVDSTITGSISASASFAALLSLSGNVQERQFVVSSACPSGVNATGTLTLSPDCPTRYSLHGSILATSTLVNGALDGFGAGQTYTLSSPAPSLTAAAVADRNGQLTFDDPGLGYDGYASGWNITTSSQGQAVATGNFAVTNPCPPLPTVTWPSRSHHTDADVTGDGLGDLLAIDFPGRLRLYQNTGLSKTPFTMATYIGTGWGPASGLSHFSANDLTGDGYAEIVATRSDGALIAYYNNMLSNPGRMPYTTGTVIGSGWQNFTDIALGDVNGDGFADIVADRNDGTRWLYVNHFKTNAGHLPFTTGVQIGTAWADPRGMVAADLNGDGYADLVGASSWWNPNRTAAGNSSPFPTPVNTDVALDMTMYSGWAVGGYGPSGADEMVISNLSGTGQLVEVESPVLSGAQKVIGSGWQAIQTLIP